MALLPDGDLKTLDRGFVGSPYCLIFSDAANQDTEDYPAFAGMGLFFNPSGAATPPPTPSAQRSVIFIISQ